MGGAFSRFAPLPVSLTRFSPMPQRLKHLRHALHGAQSRLARVLRSARGLLRRAARYAWYATAVVLALLAVVFSIARWYLPTLAERKAELEEYLSRQVAHQVRIEQLATFWEGLRPGVRIRGLAVYAAERTQPSVRLEELRLSLALVPLLWGELEVHSLVLSAPRLSLERLADGRVQILGFAPVPAEERGGAFLRWLFSLRRLAIEDGELQWFDHREPDAALSLKNVTLALRNRGNRHKLGFAADFPPGICSRCAFAADLRGNPLLGEPWQGELYLRVRDVDYARLPVAVHEWLPAGLAGRLDAELWSHWDEGRLQQLYGELYVAGLRLPLPAFARPLTVREASADLKWRREGDSWQLDLRRFSLGLSGPAWDAQHLRLVRRPQTLSVRARYLDLGDISGWLVGLGAPQKQDAGETWPTAAMARWAALQPGGAVRDLKLDLVGDPAAPEALELEAELENLRTQAQAPLPGLKGVSGHLRLSRQSGELRLAAQDAELAIPWLFRAPLPLGEVRGQLTWEREREHWLVSGTGLKLRSLDGEASGRLELRLPHAREQSPYLKLRAQFRNANGAHARRYFPAGALRPKVLEWMDRSFLGGVVTDGQLIFDGPVRAFPFRQGEGRFEVRARVRDGIYGYLPGWEPVREAQAEVLVHGDEVLVTGHGRIGALAASDVVVRYRREDGRRMVRVLGKLTGEVSESLRLLRAVEPQHAKGEWKQYLPEALRASGNGQLRLEVALELRPPDEEDVLHLTGEYHFLDSGLALSDTPIAVERLRGVVRFSEKGVREGTLAGRFLGGETTLTIATAGPNAVQARAEGRASGAALVAFLGPRLSARVSGEAPWQASLVWKQGVGRLEAQMRLAGLKSKLPPPLDYPQGLPVEKLVLRTAAATRHTHVLALSAGEAVAGRFVFERAPVLRFVSGWLALGGRAGRTLPSSEHGLTVSIRLDRLHVDPWLPLLGNGRKPPAALARVQAEVRRWRWFGREFGQTALDLLRGKEGWSGSVQGEAASGKLAWVKTGEDMRLVLDLAQLSIPPGEGGDTPSMADADPSRLPALYLRSRFLRVKGRELGELDLAAAPLLRGWHIQHLTLTHPEMRFEAKGSWQRTHGGSASAFELRFASPDLGQALAALGVPDQVAGAKTDITAALTWPGAPLDIRYAGLDGWIEIAAEKGRFLKLDPGAGRFLGILDLSAIVRYLTLDFSPIFGKGFVFDKLNARLEIENGNAYTRNFIIKGPSATIGAVGRVGFVTEDFDLVMEVRPHLSDSLTIATWGLFGPQVAAAVFALQKLFKKQIGDSTRIVYTVKGSWDNPRIERIAKRNDKQQRVGEERAPVAGEDASSGQ